MLNVIFIKERIGSVPFKGLNNVSAGKSLVPIKEAPVMCCSGSRVFEVTACHLHVMFE